MSSQCTIGLNPTPKNGPHFSRAFLLALTHPVSYTCSNMALRMKTGIVAVALLLGGLTIEHMAEENTPFYFQDRPGKLPFAEPASTEVPEGGFSDTESFERWLHGTIWKGGDQRDIQLDLYSGGKAKFTWSNPSSWKVTGKNSCQLRHARSHWTVDLIFSDDYQSFHYKNGRRSNGTGFSWGEAKFGGRNQ